MTESFPTTIGRSGLAKQIAQKVEIPYERAAEILETILGIVSESLQAGETVHLEGFGTFFLRTFVMSPGIRRVEFSPDEAFLGEDPALADSPHPLWESGVPDVIKKPSGPLFAQQAFFTILRLNQQAVLHIEQGKYGEAEPLLKQARALIEEHFGSDSALLFTNLNNLAELYRAQGQYEQVQPLLERILAIREQSVGAEHPFLVKDLNNLADLYGKLGKYAEAVPLLQRMLAIREQALGANHPELLPLLNNLAIFYMHQRKYEEAKQWLERALAIIEQSSKIEHPSIKAIRENYALLLQLMQRGIREDI